MILRIDRNVYSDSCISKSVYAIADKYAILRRVEGEEEVLDIRPLSPESGNDELISNDVIKALNDFKLRTIIEEETRDIKTIIYAKAFADYTETSQ